MRLETITQPVGSCGLLQPSTGAENCVKTQEGSLRAAWSDLARRSGSGHRAARFSACAARFSATLAVVVFVLGTLGPAGVAERGAQPAEVSVELGTPAHERGREPAERRAIPVQTDALRHHLHVGFAQAGGRAVFALLRAADTGFNARLMLTVCHGSTSKNGVDETVPASRLRLRYAIPMPPRGTPCVCRLADFGPNELCRSVFTAVPYSRIVETQADCE